MNTPAAAEYSIKRFQGDQALVATDFLAVEEPLEIRVAYGEGTERSVVPITVTMRTPPLRAMAEQDFELAMGLLLAEGVVQSRGDVERCVYCGPETAPLRVHNIVRVELAAGVAIDLARVERRFVSNSSCGLCGKTTLEALRMLRPLPVASDLVVTAELLHALPELLRTTQNVFDATGGLHAAGLFDGAGRLIVLREDIGRHNAVDKVIGSQVLVNALPLSQRVLLVSGRASFELLQKAVMAGVGIFAAVGAPSSLAVDIARQFSVTLVGFLRNGRFNVYAGEERIAASITTGVERE